MGTLPTHDYACIARDSQTSEDTNDCAVVAVAVAAAISYEYARGLLRACGRVPRLGTPMQITKDALARIDWHTANVPGFIGRSIQTVRKCKPAGVYLIETKRHVLCLRDGVIADWSSARSLRVLQVWEISRWKCEKCDSTRNVECRKCPPDELLDIHDHVLLADCIYALRRSFPHLFTVRHLCYDCSRRVYGSSLTAS